MGIKHTKTSVVADSADTTKVRPSDWNADHVIDGDVNFQGHAIVNATGGGAEAFTELTDVPATYSGSGNKLVAVNSTATALEFIEPSAGGPVDQFTDLLDVPGSFAGSAGKAVLVNTGETALEFGTAGGTAAALGWVTPQDYYPDAGSVGHETDTIDATDIAVHTEWIGTYQVDSYWSFVALQEAIYGAFAFYDSTPGNVVWNNVNARGNKVLYMPPGYYNINHQLLMVAQNFNFICSGRGTSKINWIGGRVITGNSHSTSIIDGIDASALAQISVGDELYITGPGSSPDNQSKIVSKPSSTSIQLNQALTTTVVGGKWYAFGAGFRCNAVSYGAFHNLTMFCGQPMFASTLDDVASARDPALFVMDWDGTYPGLRTQQVSLYDPYLIGAAICDVGMSISPSGGSAQGDTILIVNPHISQFARVGLAVTGGNALNIQLLNGNFQSNSYAGVKVAAGSVYVHGASFQPGIHNPNFAPQRSSVLNMSADIYMSGGGGPSSTSDIRAIRSEGQQGVLAHSSADPSVSNYGLSPVESLGRFDNYPHQLGDYIAKGSPTRTFICVDTGGPNVWYATTSVGTVNTLTLTGAVFVVNAYVGFGLFERFGSNGFVQQNGTITSNTANTVTWVGTAAAPAADSLYFIGGFSAGADPGTWTAAVTSGAVFDPVGGSQGFDITKGSTTIALGSQFGSPAVGDYFVLPQADLFGFTQADLPGTESRFPPVRWALIGQLTAFLGGTSWTMNRTAKYTMTGFPGWVQCGGGGGTVVTDGNLKWMPVDTFDFWGCATLEKCTGGRVYNCRSVVGLRSSHDYNWLRNSSHASESDSKSVLFGKSVRIKTLEIDPSVSPVDISATLEAGDVTSFTPTQNITFNAASLAAGVQKWTLIVTTSGTTSYTITFGTNFHTTGTLATGVADAKKFIIEFAVIDGVGLYELSRTGAL